MGIYRIMHNKSKTHSGIYVYFCLYTEDLEHHFMWALSVLKTEGGSKVAEE